jgi:hypothetical protein
MQDYLNDLEVATIEKFNADPLMADAVKKVIFAFINERGVAKKGKKVNPMYNGAFGLVSKVTSAQLAASNEELGQDLRAYYHACGLLEDGFNQLAKIKKVVEEAKLETNEAI